MDLIEDHSYCSALVKGNYKSADSKPGKPEAVVGHAKSTCYLPSGSCTLFLLLFLLAFHPLKAQESDFPCEWMNTLGDGQLLFRDTLTQTTYSYTPENPDIKAIISRDRKSIVCYGHNSPTQLYRLEGNSCTLVASLPLHTEYATFSHSGEQLFLLHSKSWWGMRLTAYETRTGYPLASKKVSPKANAISLNSTDSLIGLSSGAFIQIMEAPTLKRVRVHWEEHKQSLLEFSPVDPMLVASATPESVIQIRNLEQELILSEIKAHNAPVASLQFDPSGRLIFSRDEENNLVVWDISKGTHVLYRQNVEGDLAFGESGLILWRENKEVVIKQLEALKAEVETAAANTSHPDMERNPPGFVFFAQPLADWTPETEVQFGASASFLFFPRSLRPYPPAFLPSFVKPKITYAPDGKQVFTSIESEVYAQNGWNFLNLLEYNVGARNYYFGIGNQARRDVRVSYSNKVFSLQGDAVKHVGKKWKLGLGYNIRHDTSLEFERNEAVSAEGISGGWLVGGGPVLQVDFRDDFIFPTKGSFLDTRYFLYHNAFGSSFRYQEASLDYRRYFPIHSGRIPKVFAFQAFTHLTWAGDTPFYQLPYFTADRMLRGIWRNLYIDRQVAFLQTEYRSYFSPGDTRFGYVLFLGAGDAVDSFRKDWQPDPKVVYGAGYRQQLVPKLRLDIRIDFAISNKGDFGISGGAGVAF